MAMSRLSKRTRAREPVIAIDLGERTTKAVHLQRKGDTITLARYALLDAPIYEKKLSVDLLSEHLRAVCQAVGARTRVASIALSVNDALVRHVELPLMRVEDVRQVIKNNAKMYLQQDLPGYVFDCFLIPNRSSGQPAEEVKAGPAPKQKVLVAGARKQLVEDVQAAAKNAGLTVDQITPALVGPVNAFELAQPSVFAKEVVALVDIGFKNSTICLVLEGELLLTRVVAIGGDRLTSGLAEAMGVSYAEAEGIKLGMPAEVQDVLQDLITPLGRELKASIDFFEHQQDRAVGQVFFSGGSVRSEFIMQLLQGELMAECTVWNPTEFLHHALPAQQVADLEQVAPQLTVAIGTAIASL